MAVGPEFCNDVAVVVVRGGLLVDEGPTCRGSKRKASARIVANVRGVRLTSCGPWLKGSPAGMAVRHDEDG